MGVARFEINRKAADRVEVELVGELGEQMLRVFETELRAQLSVIKPGAIKVLIGLREVDGYSLEARDVLVALQRFLGTKASQTAFVADSPASRSLALWIAYMTVGQLIKSFRRWEDAAAWLSEHRRPPAEMPPATRVRPLLRAGTRSRLPRSRKAAG